MPTRNVLGEEVKAIDTKHAELFAQDETEETTTELHKDTIYKDILYTKEKIQELKENEATKPPSNENNATLEIPKIFKTEKANCVLFLATNDFYNKFVDEVYSIPYFYIPNTNTSYTIMHTSMPSTIKITKDNFVQNNAFFIKNDLLAKIYVEKGWDTAEPTEYKQILDNPNEIKFMSGNSGISNTQAFIDGFGGIDPIFYQELNDQMNYAGLFGKKSIKTLRLCECFNFESSELNLSKNPTPHKIISDFIGTTEKEVEFIFNKTIYTQTKIYNGITKCKRSAYASTNTDKNKIGYQHYETKNDPDGYFECIRVFLESYNKLVKAHTDFYNNQLAMAEEYNSKHNERYILTKSYYSLADKQEVKLTNISSLFTPFNQSTYNYIRKYLTNREIFFLNPQIFIYSDLFKDKKYAFGSNTTRSVYFEGLDDFDNVKVIKSWLPNHPHIEAIDPNFLSYILIQENFYDGESEDGGGSSEEQPPAEVDIFNSYDLLKEYILKMPFNYEQRIEILKTHIQETLRKIEIYYNGAYSVATHEQKAELKAHYDKFLETIAKETDILAYYKSQKEKTLALLEELKNDDGDGDVEIPDDSEEEESGEDITQGKEIIFDYKGDIYLFVGESITIYTIRGGDFIVDNNPNLSYQDVSEAKLLRSDYKVTALKEGKHDFVIREGNKEFIPITFIVFNMEKVELAKPELAKLAFYARKYFKNAGDCVESGTIGDYYKHTIFIIGLFNATKDNFIPSKEGIVTKPNGNKVTFEYSWNQNTKCYNKLNVLTRTEIRGDPYKVNVTYKPTPDTTPTWLHPIFLLKDRKNHDENPQELTDFINKIFTKGELGFSPTQYPASDILPMMKEAYDGRNTLTHFLDNVTWFNSIEEINSGNVGLLFENMFCGYFHVVVRKINATKYRVLETASQDVTYDLELSQWKNQMHIHNAKSVWLEDFQNLQLSENTKFILDNADFFKEKASQDHWYRKPSLPQVNIEGWGNKKRFFTKFSEFQEIYTPKYEKYIGVRPPHNWEYTMYDLKKGEDTIRGYVILEYYKNSKDTGTKLTITKEAWGSLPPSSIINNITREDMPYNINHKTTINVKFSELENKTLSILMFALGDPFHSIYIGTDSGKGFSYTCTNSVTLNSFGSYFYNEEKASIDDNLVILQPTLNFCEMSSFSFNIKFTKTGTYNICFWSKMTEIDSINMVNQELRKKTTHSLSVEIRVT